MNKLGRLFKTKRDAQSMYIRASETEVSRIAGKCNRDPLAALHIKLNLFRSELAACPEWDGDTHVHIWGAIESLKRLLVQIELLGKHRALLTSAE